MNRTAIPISRSLAVVVAGVTVGLTTAAAVAGGDGGGRDPDSYRPAAQTAITEWAAERNLSGLSPASLTSSKPHHDATAPNPAAAQAAIAEWAREHDLTGLSPASLQPIGD